MTSLLAQSILLSTKTFLPGDLPEAERLERLRPYFKPLFDETLQISDEEETNRQKLHTPIELRGFITLSPPKGYCFVVQTRAEQSDQSVCQKQVLTFRLKDIDARGKISWLVKTGPNDMGTPISWQTPYRLGRYIDYSMPWPGNSLDFVIKGCDTLVSRSRGRLIKVHHFHQSSWSIKLPAKDQLVPQPERDKPNLFVQVEEPNALSKLKDKGQNGGEEATPPPPAKEEEEQAKKAEAEKAAAPAPKTINSIKAQWQSHPRDAYALAPERVIIETANPSGLLGECRYKYADYELAAGDGLLECQHVGPYRWLYLPLSCIARLKP